MLNALDQERTQRDQSQVAAANAVMPLQFQMIQKRQDQHQGVAVAGHCAWVDIRCVTRCSVKNCCTSEANDGELSAVALPPFDDAQHIG